MGKPPCVPQVIGETFCSADPLYYIRSSGTRIFPPGPAGHRLHGARPLRSPLLVHDVEYLLVHRLAGQQEVDVHAGLARAHLPRPVRAIRYVLCIRS
jgi:hypothetical protein